MKFVNFVDELTRLQPFLYRFAYSLTKNHEAAKDLLQETLLKTLENREKFIEDTNLRAWMCAIMKNTFINDYRKLLLAHESVCRIDDLKSEPCMIDGTDANYDLEWINKVIAGMKRTDIRFGNNNKTFPHLYLHKQCFVVILHKYFLAYSCRKEIGYKLKIYKYVQNAYMWRVAIIRYRQECYIGWLGTTNAENGRNDIY